MRARGVGIIVSLAVAATGLGIPATATAAHGAAPAARSMDANGDRVVDSLGRHIDRAGADQKTPVLVVFDDAPPEQLAAAQRRFGGGRVLRRAQAVATTMTPAQVRAAARLDGVRRVEPDYRMSTAPIPPKPEATAAPSPSPNTAPNATPNASPKPNAPPSGGARMKAAGTLFSPPWSFGNPSRLEPGGDWANSALGLDGDSAKDGDKAYGPADMVIAVVDTGISTSYQSLDEGKVIHAEDFAAADRDLSCGLPPAGAYSDELGHGTHVASIVASDRDAGGFHGMAPAAALVDLKVFDCMEQTTTSRVAAALEWLLDHHAAHGIEVVNMSLGSSEPTDGTDVVSRLVNQLTAAGLVVVVAAGNTGPGADTIGTPGSAVHAVTVGATSGALDGRVVAAFSSRGPTLDGRVKPDILAPGTGVSTHPGMFAGTSASAPFVSGIAALVLAADPARRPTGTICGSCPSGVNPATMRNGVADVMRTTAQNWGGPGKDAVTGDGELRGAAAIAAAASTTAPALTYAGHGGWAGQTTDRDRGDVYAITVGAAGGYIGVSAQMPQPDFFGEPHGSIEVFDANGVELGVHWQCDGWCTPPQASLAGHHGGWFQPQSTGRHYIRFRTTTPQPYTLDVDGALTGAARVAAPGLIVKNASAVPLFEGSGATGAVTVRLASAPPRPITLAVSTDGRLAANPSTVSFDAGNWSQTKTVSVAVVNDDTGMGLHAGAVRFTTPAGNVDGATFGQVSVAISDDDAVGREGGIERVSLTPSLAPSFINWSAWTGSQPVVSDDGRYIAFDTAASDLGPADANGFDDVYVRDRQNATTERISMVAGKPEQGVQAFLQGMSADGNKVMFQLWGPGSLWPGDTESRGDVYVKDRRTGALDLVLMTSSGRLAQPADCGGNEPWALPVMVPNGSAVVFETPCRLVSADIDNVVDVYVRDLATRSVTRLATTGAAAGSQPSQALAVDRTGRFIAHDRARSDGKADLVLIDRSGGSPRVVNTSGGQSLGLTQGGATVVVADGAAKVAFDSEQWRAHVADTATGVVTDLSTGPNGQSPYSVWLHDLSPDGRTAIVETQDPAIIGRRDILSVPFFQDVATGVREPVLGVRDSATQLFRYSSNGRFLAFRSQDPTLVPGDTNVANDVFVKTMPGGATPLRPAPPRSPSAAWEGNDLRVSWTRPVTSGGADITSYSVRVQPSSGGAVATVTVPGTSLTAAVSGLSTSTAHNVEVRAVNAVGTGDPAVTTSNAGATTTRGYWMLTAAGDVHGFGAAVDRGGVDLGGTAVDIEPTPTGNGYWILSSAGFVHPVGDAKAMGSALLDSGEQATSLSATPNGGGYWVFTNRGRALAFGNAPRLGDMAGVPLNGPVLDSIPTPSGQGYYMVASDGGIFAFGDAVFAGSMGGQRLNAPVQSLVPDPDGGGYWLVASDGGVFAFGAPFLGSMGSATLNRPVTGMVPYADGYLMVGEDGGIFNFSSGPFLGSLGANPPPTPVVAVAALR